MIIGLQEQRKKKTFILQHQMNEWNKQIKLMCYCSADQNVPVCLIHINCVYLIIIIFLLLPTISMFKVSFYCAYLLLFNWRTKSAREVNYVSKKFATRDPLWWYFSVKFSFIFKNSRRLVMVPFKLIQFFSWNFRECCALFYERFQFYYQFTQTPSCYRQIPLSQLCVYWHRFVRVPYFSWKSNNEMYIAQ